MISAIDGISIAMPWPVNRCAPVSASFAAPNFFC